MKILVATDIHGSLSSAQSVVDKFLQQKADKIILLGDLYYHGPRNPLSNDYAPMKVCELFNEYSDKILVTRGNCDARVDSFISKFPFVDRTELNINGKRIVLSHGDLPELLSDLKSGDIEIHGHFHINELAENGGITHICVSSPTLPKNNCAPAYAIINDNNIQVLNIYNNSIIFEKSL